MDGAMSQRLATGRAGRPAIALAERLATGPVSWGVDFADSPGIPRWPVVLDGIAAAGYAGTELGPLGFLPREPGAFVRRGLTLTGGFIFEPLHDPRETTRVVRLAARVARAVAGLGGRYLLIIDSVSDARAATAGRSGEAARLSPAARDALAEAVACAAAAAEREGVVPLLHPHAGTYVEFADEIEPLRSICGMCADTGHLAYAGIDPVAFVAADPGSIGCVHLKDLDTSRVRPDFWASVAAGAFVPLGRGDVDFPALMRELERTGYDGWMVVEQDRLAGAGDPVADLVASREFVEGVVCA
jgi:inosose dehydratase